MPRDFVPIRPLSDEALARTLRAAVDGMNRTFSGDDNPHGASPFMVHIEQLIRHYQATEFGSSLQGLRLAQGEAAKELLSQEGVGPEAAVFLMRAMQSATRLGMGIRFTA